MKRWLGRTVRTTIFAALVIAGTASILATHRTGPGESSCPPLGVGVLTQPTAAITLVRIPDPDVATPVFGPASGNHNWALVDATGNEHFMNVGFAPQGGWPIPAETRELAFEMFVRDEAIQWPFNKPEAYYVVFLLEFTFPEVSCPTVFEWDTDLALSLPGGVCFTPGAVGVDCSADVEGEANFDLLVVEDPSGEMSVEGPGRGLLADGIDDASSEPPDLELLTSSSARLYEGESFDGAFTAPTGAEAHLYVGVGVILLTDTAYQLCLANCGWGSDERVSDHAVFRPERGSSRGVGYVATGRP